MPRLPPGPPPFAKNPLTMALFAKRVAKDALGLQRERYDRFGDIYTSIAGNLTTIGTRVPQYIQKVLVQDADSYIKSQRGLGVAQLRRLLGDGLVNSDGETWRQHRRQIQPAFDTSHLRAYADTMTEFTEQHARSWKARDVVDVSHEMMELTLRIVVKVLMGKDIRVEGDVGKTLLTFRGLFGGLNALLPEWVPYPPRRREYRATQHMRKLMDRYIEDHASALGEDEHCLLRVLASQLGEPDSMTRAQLRDEALTLFFAGHETTSHALTWTLYLLARHPRERQLLFDEVDEVLGKRRATFDDFSKLQYTSCALSEAMRLFPPVHTVLREACHDTSLGPYDVPKGTQVLLSIYHVHHDQRWHDAPEQFRPQRFEPDQARKIEPGAYLPFGAGKRTCIGKRFALMEATLILAALAQHWRLEATSSRPAELSATITLAPRGGLPLRVATRTS